MQTVQSVSLLATIAVSESETTTVKSEYPINVKDNSYPPIDWSLSNNKVYMTIATTQSIKDR